MSAQLVHAFKNVDALGRIVEMKVWRVPVPVPPAAHLYKYRLVYVVDGKRVLGMDNERGKGDHVHVESVEAPYRFVSVEQLIEDFIQLIERWQQGEDAGATS